MHTVADLPVPCRELLAMAEAAERIATVAEARQRATEIRTWMAGQVESGLDGLLLARLISSLNDRIVCRVIALTVARHRLPQVPWCWLALGSEGRCEQTFVTDQDNGLIFSATDTAEAEALRRLFLPFAQEVNGALDTCGFTLCQGEIMAGNPKWCLALEEWESQFIDWVRRPEPMALMHASIFFDLRPIYGDIALGERLRDVLLHLTTSTPVFLHLMAVNALQAPPPLGLLGDVVVEGNGEGNGVDVKKFGARIFVDAARIFALASGVRAVETRQRLSEAGPRAGLPASEVAGASAALSHLLRLRLASQAAALAAGEAPDHCVQPERLVDLDRTILRESLRQAKRVQQRLKLNYAL